MYSEERKTGIKAIHDQHAEFKDVTSRCIWSVDIYGSEIWTLGKNKESVINAFETWCSRRILEIRE